MNMTGSREPDAASRRLQLDAGHPAQVNIQNEAGRLGCCGAGKEGLARSEGLYLKTLRAQETFNRLEHGRVVVNHRDDLSPN